MKALIAQLLSAAEDSFWDLNNQFVRLGPPARDAALSWLRSPNPLHRERACHVLAEVQKRPIPRYPRPPHVWDIDHTPIPHLIRILENDPDKDVRCAAARALKFQGEPQGLPALLRAAHTNDPDICYWVAMELSIFNVYPEELRPLLPTAHKIMLQLLNNPDENVRDWAAHAAQCDAFNIPAINAALWKLTKDVDGGVRGEALSALAHHGDRRAIPNIRRALFDSDTAIWSWLFEGIVKMQAVELIPDLLAFGDEEARKAVQKLQKIASQRRASGVAPTV
ncbi:MAG: HEAT repeat domain-containing protein [Armatimonas sp.]